MKKILLIAGTRPNFIKLAPLYHTLISHGTQFETFICHTGQHFDFNMSDVFWNNLELPHPDFNLGIQGKNVVDTIGKTMLGINDIIQSNHFDLIIVFGDVNATVAGAIAGVQSRIPVMHIEAGLRSFDRDMPEEINRILTDHVSDYLMVSEQSGLDNLKREGFPDEKIFYVGNIMIESLIKTQSKWKQIVLHPDIEKFLLNSPAVATFHRPENVDHLKHLNEVVQILKELSAEMPVIFPIHPRTKSQLTKHNILNEVINPNILITDPLGYFEFIQIISRSRVVVTDSGGVQEETTYLNIPCVTFRKNTERPVTLEMGTNILLQLYESDRSNKIINHILLLNSKPPLKKVPLWDDQVSNRIMKSILVK
jgi:UDP-N-acetylglucosamine 2-epimerase (non-hydrolysing)